MLSKKSPIVVHSSSNSPDINLNVSDIVENNPMKEFVVITHPSLERDSPDMMQMLDFSDIESDNSQYSAVSSSADVSDNDSTVDDQKDSYKKKGKLNVSKRLSTSQSLGSIVANYRNSRVDTTRLQLPKRSTTNNSRSRGYSLKNTVPISQTSPDVRIVRLSSQHKKGSTFPGHKALSRTRSSSPSKFAFSHLRAGKTLSLGETSLENTKAAWSRTLRFLSGKSTSVPDASLKEQREEELVGDFDSIGSTSDGVEGTDMIIAQNATDSLQCEGTNGVEPLITATHTMTLGSTTSSTSYGNGLPGDVVDGVSPANEAQRDHLQQKILKISEQITIEQASRDENVAEYLKLAKDADRQQAARIKSVFEKKNQKSKANVMQLQKKLETYHKRLKEMESGSKNFGGKYGLKEVGAKLTDLSGSVVGSMKQGASGIVSRPRDIASKLMNKRFGSVDNISTLKEEDAGSDELERSNSVGNVSSINSDSGEISADLKSLNSSRPHLSHQQQQNNQQTEYFENRIKELSKKFSNLENEVHRIKELESQHERIKIEIDQLSSKVLREIGHMRTVVSEDTYRCSRVEDQLHDLSEMHHRELGDIKQDLSSLEEKLEYHAQERARDIQEALESCQTRISKMEVQQQHQHQQLVTMEGVESATARALLGKLINLLLSVLAVILVFVSTVSSIVMPFFRSQTRIVMTGMCVLFIAVLYRNWEPWTLYISQLWTGR